MFNLRNRITMAPLLLLSMALIYSGCDTNVANKNGGEELVASQPDAADDIKLLVDGIDEFEVMAPSDTEVTADQFALDVPLDTTPLVDLVAEVTLNEVDTTEDLAEEVNIKEDTHEPVPADLRTATFALG